MQWQMSFGVMTVKLMIEKSLPRRHKGSKKREEKILFIRSSCLSALMAIVFSLRPLRLLVLGAVCPGSVKLSFILSIYL